MLGVVQICLGTSPHDHTFVHEHHHTNLYDDVLGEMYDSIDGLLR